MGRKKGSHQQLYRSPEIHMSEEGLRLLKKDLAGKVTLPYLRLGP